MWYSKSLAELFRLTESCKNGLNSEEAQIRLAKHGKNELQTARKKGVISRFFAALCDRMTVILLIAAAISFGASYLEGDMSADPIIILMIVLLNAVIAVVQETKAEKALEALKRLSSPEATVLRDGVQTVIPASELVTGDVFFLKKGDIVPCDARLIGSNSLTVDESALTGESMGVSKNASAKPVGSVSDSLGCVFSSTSVLTGTASALAVKTGSETQVGLIAGMLTGEAEKTPLQKRLARLSALLGNVTLVICFLIFGLSLLKHMDVGEMFLTSVSLSVAAIPEGLPAIVTVVLSVGVRTMARKKAVVKRLPAVETLGCAGVICSDKTGTLTCNKMTVTEVHGDTEALRLAFVLCNDLSSPTEAALNDYFEGGDALRAEYPRVKEIPFDSSKKYMITAHRAGNRYKIIVKGAPEAVFALCREKRDFSREIAEMTSRALRVMAFAEYEIGVLPDELSAKSFRPIGVCGMSDPPRPEVKDAIRVCVRAGIRPIMITGDHPDTALAIAREIGLAGENASVATEKDISGASERALIRLVKKTNVFARVTPESKLRIVGALQKSGAVVAMTGDGINDAPALKKADIGCAMGKSGTEVAKEASDLILTDDNFATIVTAVHEGRGVFDNIRRAVHFLLSCNIGELCTVFFALLLSMPTPLSAIQLLWINLTTDSLPAIALGLERTPDSVMLRPPVSPDSPLFPIGRAFRIAFEGILIGMLATAAFFIGSRTDFTTGRTMCFAVLGMSQLFHSFNLRCENSVFAKSETKNPFVAAAFAICLAMQASVILIPAASSLFGVCGIGISDWVICLLLSVCPIAASEIYKLFKINRIKC